MVKIRMAGTIYCGECRETPPNRTKSIVDRPVRGPPGKSSGRVSKPGRPVRSTGGTAPRSAGRHGRKETDMSFQAYLDAVEDKTGKTPRQLVDEATAKGFDAPAVKAGVIVEWLRTDYGVGRGHAMAMVHVIKKGPQISTKHVGRGGSHGDASDLLWLDGKASRPA
jgi:hypothetical protein